MPARLLSLTGSGTAAALAIGAAALNMGPRWPIVLLVYFAAATAVTRHRAAEKVRRAGAFLEKAGARDAAQVLANGGAFAGGLIIAALTAEPAWVVFAAGALATSSADTWATELGLLSSRPPRSILSNAPVPAGASGGVTLAGSLAGVAGSAVVAVTVAALRAGPASGAIFLGGVAGMFIDSFLGATIQERRWCPECARASERRIHACGAITERTGGLHGLRNDGVNALATLAGGTVAAAIWAIAW